MQIGCGVYVHIVRRRPYLYFWHYETRGRGRVQVKEYIGPARLPRSLSKAAQRCDTYYARAAADLERLRVTTLSALRRAS